MFIIFFSWSIFKTHQPCCGWDDTKGTDMILDVTLAGGDDDHVTVTAGCLDGDRDDDLAWLQWRRHGLGKDSPHLPHLPLHPHVGWVAGEGLLEVTDLLGVSFPLV